MVVLQRYFGRSDAALGGDALFAFIVGLVAVMLADPGGPTGVVATDAGQAVVRAGAGAMLLATFVAAVAVTRSLLTEWVRAGR